MQCTFVHDGVFGELEAYFSSGPHGGGTYDVVEGQLHPRSLSFSFLGSRFEPHHLFAAPIPGGDDYRNYLVIHRGRKRAGRRRSIEAKAIWALLRRQSAESLGSQRRYDELVAWIRTRQRMMPAQDHQLAVIPSRL